MKFAIHTFTVIFGSLILMTSSAKAEDVAVIFKRVQDFIQANNYPKALEELGWAKTEIEKMNAQKLQSFLPEDVAGYKGQKIETNNALGFLNLERNYLKGSDRIQVSLTGGSGNGAMGGLAQFGKMAAMFGGGQNGQETIRVSGKTATFEKNDDAKTASLSIFLDSGYILKLDTRGTSDKAALQQIAESLKLDELDKYLKG